VPVVSKSGETVQCDSWAVRDDSHLWVFVYNWDMYGEPMITRHISIVISDVARTGKPNVSLRMIDDKNANARPVWESLGKPTYPTAKEIQSMLDASQIVYQPVQYTVDNTDITISLTVMPYGVAMLTVPLDYA